LIEPVLLLKTFLDALEGEIKEQILNDNGMDAVIATALKEYKTIRGWQAK
jgi:hypothetical protein